MTVGALTFERAQGGVTEEDTPEGELLVSRHFPGQTVPQALTESRRQLENSVISDQTNYVPRPIINSAAVPAFCEVLFDLRPQSGADALVNKGGEFPDDFSATNLHHSSSPGSLPPRFGSKTLMSLNYYRIPNSAKGDRWLRRLITASSLFMSARLTWRRHPSWGWNRRQWKLRECPFLGKPRTDSAAARRERLLG